MGTFKKYLSEESFKETRRKELVSKIKSSKLSDASKKLNHQIAKEHSNINDIEQHHRDMDNLKEDVQDFTPKSIEKDRKEKAAPTDPERLAYRHKKEKVEEVANPRNVISNKLNDIAKKKNPPRIPSPAERRAQIAKQAEVAKAAKPNTKVDEEALEDAEIDALIEGNSVSGWSPKKMVKHLKRNGFEFKRNGGSHDVYHHPETKEVAAIPRHNKDLAPGTAKQLLDKIKTPVKESEELEEKSVATSDYKTAKDGRQVPSGRITFRDFTTRKPDEKDKDEKDDGEGGGVTEDTEHTPAGFDKKGSNEYEEEDPKKQAKGKKVKTYGNVKFRVTK